MISSHTNFYNLSHNHTWHWHFIFFFICCDILRWLCLNDSGREKGRNREYALLKWRALRSSSRTVLLLFNLCCSYWNPLCLKILVLRFPTVALRGNVFVYPRHERFGGSLLIFILAEMSHFCCSLLSRVTVVVLGRVFSLSHPRKWVRLLDT